VRTSRWSLSTRELDQPTKEAKQITATPLAGAAPRALADWHAINWPKVYQNVRRLQTHIVQATKDGRSGKVKALQRRLTRSFSRKALPYDE
jgi:RNA-directed DNA polymerase